MNEIHPTTKTNRGRKTTHSQVTATMKKKMEMMRKEKDMDGMSMIQKQWLRAFLVLTREKESAPYILSSLYRPSYNVSKTRLLLHVSEN